MLDDGPQHLQTLACPHCGASTPVTGDGSTVACEYCGERVAVPPGHRVAPALDQATRDALEEGHRSVRRIVENRSGSDMAAEPIAVIVGIIVGFVVLALLYDDADDSFLLAGFACTASWLFISIVGIFIGAVLGRGVARLRAWRIDRALELRRRNAKCPRCGAAVAIPGGTVVLDCAHCQARIVATQGLVAAWTEDLAQCVKVWEDEAEAAGKQLGLWFGRLVAFGIFGFLFSAAVGPFVYLVYLIADQ